MTLTFHGDPALKAKLLTRIAAHEASDRIAQGVYWEADTTGKWRGCAVGCSLRDLGDTNRVPAAGGWHAEMELVLGVPAWLAELEDEIFEALPADEAASWPRRFSEAVPVGVDLDAAGLADRLAVRRLRETVLPLAGTWPDALRGQVTDAIEKVIAALQGVGDRSAAWSAAAAAQAAAGDAEDAAAWSAAQAAADAATAAAIAADAAAQAAADAALDAAAQAAAWSAEADRLIDELRKTS